MGTLARSRDYRTWTEVMDFEVIVHITGQLHRQVRDMPPGTRISGFTIAAPPSPSGQG